VTDRIDLWIGFNVFVLLMLALDLGVFHREPHVVRAKEALLWSVGWVLVALAFNAGIYYWWGSQKALEFLTGYMIERVLSIDNIFVFLLIFSYFKVPSQYEHKILFWGILGALIMRAAFIFAGIRLIEMFHWIIYVFGSFLILAGIKTAFTKPGDIHPEKNPLLKLFTRFVTCSDGYDEGKFFVKIKGSYCATTLFIVLLFVEMTDVIFALDSIPAILGITLDPFIVYTSNVFAILGLRALYFALAAIMRVFSFLHYGLAAILVFVGIKMLIAEFYEIPVLVALIVITTILALSVIFSLIFPEKNTVSQQPEYSSNEPSLPQK
jgi:tellurite resistance protein TerC